MFEKTSNLLGVVVADLRSQTAWKRGVFSVEKRVIVTRFRKEIGCSSLNRFDFFAILLPSVTSSLVDICPRTCIAPLVYPLFCSFSPHPGGYSQLSATFCCSQAYTCKPYGRFWVVDGHVRLEGLVGGLAPAFLRLFDGVRKSAIFGMFYRRFIYTTAWTVSGNVDFCRPNTTFSLCVPCISARFHRYFPSK